MQWLKFEFTGMAVYTDFVSFLNHEGFVGDVYYRPGSSITPSNLQMWCLDSRKARLYKFADPTSESMPSTFATDFPNAFEIPNGGFQIDNQW